MSARQPLVLAPIFMGTSSDINNQIGHLEVNLEETVLLFVKNHLTVTSL